MKSSQSFDGGVEEILVEASGDAERVRRPRRRSGRAVGDSGALMCCQMARQACSKVGCIHLGVSGALAVCESQPEL